MAKNVIVEQIKEVVKVETKFSVIEGSAGKFEYSLSKSYTNLKTEEQALKTQLNNLKKENFFLKSITQAWKTTYGKKQKELEQSEAKLNKVYDEIWSKREEFCERAEKFNNEYGILSESWKKRMNEFLNPLQEKPNGTHKEKPELAIKIEKMEEIEILAKEEKSQVFDVEFQDGFASNRNEVSNEPSPEQNRSENVTPAEENESSTSFNELGEAEFNEVPEKLDFSERETNEGASKSTTPENNAERPKKKKVRFSKENDQITIFYENPGTLKMKFLSIVDAETVKKAKRFKNNRKPQFSLQPTKPQNKVA